MNQVCYACKQSHNSSMIIKHHISYFPEIIVPVHRSCHTKIHAGRKYQDLKPSKEEVKRFYGQSYGKHGKIIVIDISKESLLKLKHKAVDNKTSLRQLVIKTLEKIVK